MMKISLIVPCYNEEASLSAFYSELTKVSSEMGEYEFEYIFIDDGSKDKTLSIIKDFANSDKRVSYISFSKNFGKEAAMYAGFCNSCGDYVAVMDADMQDPPSLLPKMVEILNSGEYDSVATRRVTRHGESKIRSFFANWFYRVFNHTTDVKIVSGARDFRLMKREMVDAIISMCEKNRFSKGIYGWIGFKTYWLPFDNVERVAGKSKWNVKKLFRYSFDGIFSFSNRPLKIPFYLAILCACASIAPLAYMIYHAITHCFLMSSTSITSSLILFAVLLVGAFCLFSIGILGEYIAKIYGEVKGRPHYIVAQTNKKDVVKK
ncbi:MAG: glycosyltransferase family 2 protein [Clostridia bacterium]|nr:glycosyltransferase family 2 protein [Clostridia bacterium]